MQVCIPQDVIKGLEDDTMASVPVSSSLNISQAESCFLSADLFESEKVPDSVWDWLMLSVTTDHLLKLATTTEVNTNLLLHDIHLDTVKLTKPQWFLYQMAPLFLKSDFEGGIATMIHEEQQVASYPVTSPWDPGRDGDFDCCDPSCNSH